ncbi:MAG: Asp-tRNA(Asn)/Glu-tRNA(Gln) amidotransferase subunit GatB [Oscillospiraceae bacterium]|jgi:aspartyl-tRNA(Asn)/glutamyl-tRNA(Gln) amidotransferase subunit B|nr:Asp-tRNA(Asn)/Glu-tRNA(Gln) amidotransferase subunit GatB [Oscillospiraceae bacterium]MCI1990773.1 Asp-tRNA(Asn)/Glu-tRNA(Gln) amidotransferase subunit GatB [Oscillospiraceae bacterium]MCI2035158.1 Asp-tRNA(Asn)/Glu-tRNA(Gln) amidotransferase subunit GatB [Oscillospiraceae bacterium]
MNYELVCGLETHVELATKTKIFCSCTTEFGAEPNTHCCPVCIGLPGTLPKLNKAVVEYAVTAGLATHCEINPDAKMDRKNYVYPDLPKAYQISEYDQPLCRNGYVELASGKKIRLTRIHIEEDAGKLVHERGNTLIDYNRGGVPLIEIVSEPDIRSIGEAAEYVEQLQAIMRYIGVSDCKMQEGSLRCDVNVSVRPQGSDRLGTRTEIKNMNSFSHMTKAIQYEMDRQIDLLESGEDVVQETRRYNEETGCTEGMRGKEDANDYRYFRDPDLVAIRVTDDMVAALKAKMPEGPQKRLARFQTEYGLPEADARLLIDRRRIADYFEAAAKGTKNPRTVANCILGPIFSRLDSDAAKDEFRVSVSPENLNALVGLLDAGKIRKNLVKSTLEKMLDTGKPAAAFLSEKDLAGVNPDDLRKICEQAAADNPNAVKDYRGGKEKALKAVLGAVMKMTRGRANPQEAEKILTQIMKA